MNGKAIMIILLEVQVPLSLDVPCLTAHFHQHPDGRRVGSAPWKMAPCHMWNLLYLLYLSLTLGFPGSKASPTRSPCQAFSSVELEREGSQANVSNTPHECPQPYCSVHARCC